MKVIDIDNITIKDSHIHYRKEYSGRVLLLDKVSKIHRHEIEFSLEYKALEEPHIQVKFIDPPHYPIGSLVARMKELIADLDSKGTLAALHKK